MSRADQFLSVPIPRSDRLPIAVGFGRGSFSSRISRVLQHHFILLLIGSYFLAALWPAPGQALRAATLAEISLRGQELRITLPIVMLAFLLFNAGLAVRVTQLRNLLRRPFPLVLGLFFNLTLPVLCVVGMIWIMRIWHPPEVDEIQDMLAGLALIATVPVAGSSTAWAQSADGDMALSIGLVLFSTLLAPFTAPLSIACIEPLAVGGYATGLARLGTVAGSLLLVAGILIPAMLGLLANRFVGPPRAARIMPVVKPMNLITLLVLNYANAAVALPRLAENPDTHFLSSALILATGLCVMLFTSGRALGRVFRLNRPQRISLTFGLGMTNNGTGLVLASVALGQYPRIVLPIIIYNLIQHAVAGTAQRMMK
jgi:BASS family bile acid:Na+ symporter